MRRSPSSAAWMDGASVIGVGFVRYRTKNSATNPRKVIVRQPT